MKMSTPIWMGKVNFSGNSLASLFSGMPLLLLSGLFLALSFSSAAQAPTVNGLFYCDGDSARYMLLQEATGGRGKVYYYLDGPILYVALMVNPNTNDNVFGNLSDPNDVIYLDSVGWAGTGNNQGAKHTANALIGSDHGAFSLQCATQSFTWQQDYIYTTSPVPLDPKNVTWLSDPYGPDGAGTPPGTIISSSSLVHNFANSSWDVTLGGTRTNSSTWKSPNLSDWPKCDDGTSWEWPVLYEFSVNLQTEGCDLDDFIFVDPTSGHNSPVKDGLGDDVFFDPVTLRDYGDAPDSYKTLGASGGAYHTLTINGPKLGSLADSDTDGAPAASNDPADGDDLDDGTDDEDGVVLPAVVNPGQTVSITVNASNASFLDAFFDFNRFYTE